MSIAKKAWVGRLVGAVLIAEGIVVAILRLLTLVYVVASEAYSADRFRTPMSRFLPWVLISIGVTVLLVWAGSLLRRAPEGAWAEVGLDARIDLAVAFLLNFGALVSAALGVARSPSTVEGWLTWVAIGLVSLVAVIGLARDAVARPPTG